eukprot:Skav215915  [mRNA]  locus=scaffold226:82179:86864:- [translate_table: standard]
MNLRPQTQDVWKDFEALGFREVFEQFHLLRGVDLPPTCAGATRNDTLLYSRHFANCFVDASVHAKGLFPTHDPLLVTFNMETFVHSRRVLPMPCALNSDVLKSQLFQHNQQLLWDDAAFHPEQENPVTLEDVHKHATRAFAAVADVFERAYDKTVDDLNRYMGGDQHFLARAKPQEKRLRPRKPTFVQPKVSPARARQGDYEPPFEVYNVKHLQLVKQIRRIQALLRRLKKTQNTPVADHVNRQNWQEWFAITSNRAFRPNFAAWCLRGNVINTWYHDLPTAPWLQSLFDALKVVVDDMIRKTNENRRKHFTFRVQVDLLHFGGSIASAVVKEKRNNKPVAFEVDHHVDAQLLRKQGKGAPLVCLPKGCPINLAQPLNIHGKQVTLKPTTEDCIFAAPGLPGDVASKFQLSQKKMSNNPDEVSKAFFEFWTPFWMRDEDASANTPEAWSDFLAMMRGTPMLCASALDQSIHPNEWRLAISRTKVETSRGVCGLSQPEMASMHDLLLSKLVDIINTLGSSGLPPWIMLAKVLLVPKTEEATAIPKMRPITVFSLLFRLWAKVVAHRLLMTWKVALPPNVVGAVPGRACTQLSLTASVRVENKLLLGCEAGGFSLDIEKCYNTFARFPIMLLMRYHGMSDAHAEMWFASVSKMTRTASLLDSFSLPSGACTGLAEGDPLAVCAMVLVGYTWHELVTAVASVWTSLFADDWQWHASDASQHIKAMQATIQFLQALKLSLDPHKSWCWGTTTKARKAWHSINLEVVGSPKYFAITTTERVLGVCMHFARQLNHGCLSTRLDAGIARLERLAKLNLPIDQAARLIQSTIWPMTLFGTDVVYVGKKHFSKLRSLASAVLVKKTAVTSTYLTMTTLTSRTVDPFVYTVSRAICLWRRLFMLDQCNRGLYVQTLAAATDNPCKAFGPAGALKSYLQVLGWSVNDDASITDHAQRTFFLENVTPAFIVSTIRDAWDAHISHHVRGRVDFDGWPEIDHVLTCRVPLPEDARQRAVVAKLRTLGSLYATQREHWEGHEEWITGECPLCQSADTRDHFPFKCQQIAPLRQEYERTLQRATLDFPHACFLPVVHKHPKQSITAYLHHKRELPDAFNLETYDLPLSHMPVFFTDGSAAFPKLGGQIAAWSIVLDLAVNDLQRVAIVNGMDDLRQTPSTLVPVQISLVAGAQTINRAELQAIFQIVRSVDSAIIYTDSAWAIERFLEVRQCPNPERFWNQHHSDILIQLRELAQTKDFSNFTLCKIKSHQDIVHLTDPVNRYLAMGNRFADELAKHATEKHHSPMHRLCWEIATWYAGQLEVLVALQPFLAKAESLRLDAMQKQTPNVDFAVKEHFSVEHAILWQPANLQPPLVFEIPERLLSAFQPSPGALMQMVQWALTLQWPSEDNVSGGISWYELLINFLLITQCKIPVQTERKKQHPVFRDFAIHEDAILFQQSVWDCVRFLETGFNYIKRFTGVSLAPLHMQKTRWFLSAYGYQKRISGVSVRPVLPCQLDHIRLLKSAISENELHLPDLSGLSCWFPRQILPQDHLSHRDRYLNHRALAYYVRRHGVLS